MPEPTRTVGMPEEALNDLGRRLAAAFVSYTAGYKGVDRMLAKTPEAPGAFWIELAKMLFQAMADGVFSDDLHARDVITKYIQ